ncbi:MAG: CBS domain-containing protein [Nitrospiraceae bacterium]|nr:MAG: CBS domain-containing protein [Nitrospiraceae bacterium]
MEKSEGTEKSIPLEISDRDIHEAMKEIPGYTDITSGDFKELYRVAYRHALKRISQSITAEDIMTKAVVTVRTETPLQEVAEIMTEKGVSGVPVIEEDGRVAGMISEKDFLSRMGAKDTNTFMGVIAECLRGKGCVALSVRAKKAEDIMSTPPITVNENSSLMDITSLFSERKINRVPVIDKKNTLIGIVSREDIVEAPLLRGKSG